MKENGIHWMDSHLVFSCLAKPKKKKKSELWLLDVKIFYCDRKQENINIPFIKACRYFNEIME